MPFQRKNIRLRPENYLGQRWYFVTICCANRRPFLAPSARAFWLIDMLRSHAASHSFGVYAYCVMPDHLHFLAYGLQGSSNLLAFVRELKHQTGQQFQQETGEHLWQKKYYDHILRRTATVDPVAAYVWMNPVRKGLCWEANQYKFSGSFMIEWKNAPLSKQPWHPPWKSRA